MRRVVTAPAAAEGLRAARAWLTQPGTGSAGRKRRENLRATRRRLAVREFAADEGSGPRLVRRDMQDHAKRGDRCTAAQLDLHIQKQLRIDTRLLQDRA